VNPCWPVAPRGAAQRNPAPFPHERVSPRSTAPSDPPPGNRQRLSRRLALVWVVAAVVGLGLIGLQQQTGWASPLAFPLLAALAAGAALTVMLRTAQQRPNEREISRVIEAAYPELRGLLLTAVEQLRPALMERTVFLQHRVLQQAVEHCQETGNWRAAVPSLRGRWQDAAQLAALALFAATLWQGRALWRKPGRRARRFLPHAD